METIDMAAPGIQRLSREIRMSYSKLRNSIINRRYHPSYGYTKKMIRENHAELLAMCVSWLYVTGLWNHSGSVLWINETYDIIRQWLDIDLEDVSMSVDNVLKGK